ncbi:MAG: cytochrome c [Pseudobdellovibrionaceae bacterium]|nr:cytochrome c [Pseudobdellovibrionaceae bacterium]
MFEFFKKLSFCLFLSFGSQASAESVLDNCTSCHVEEKKIASTFDRHPIGTAGADLQCYACHIKLIRGDTIKGFPQILRSSLGPRMQKKQTYAQAKGLVFKLPQSGQPTLMKYNEEGFFRYLKNPVPRHHFQTPSSMYPVGTGLEQKLRVELKKALEPAHALAPDAQLMQHGEQLFVKNCVSCHGEKGPGPLLRLGVPLLSERYIVAIMEGKVSGIAPGMPRFSDLRSEDKAALAHYLQFAKAEKKTNEAPKEALGLLLPQELYPKVIVPLLGSSCRHCHADSPAKQEIFQNMFGYERPIRFLMERTKRGYEPTADGMTMLLPKAGTCEPSEFLQRLSARHKEAKGEISHDKPGMPLTMPPVSTAALDNIRSWQRSGCFVDGKRLCEPCVSKTH